MVEIVPAEQDISPEDLVTRLTESAQIALNNSGVQPVINEERQARSLQRWSFSVWDQRDKLSLKETANLDDEYAPRQYEYVENLTARPFNIRTYSWTEGGKLVCTDKMIGSDLTREVDTSRLTQDQISKIEQSMDTLATEYKAPESSDPQLTSEQPKCGKLSVAERLVQLIFRRS